MNEQDWTDFPRTREAVEASEPPPSLIFDREAEELTRALRQDATRPRSYWVDSGSGPGWSRRG